MRLTCIGMIALDTLLYVPTKIFGSEALCRVEKSVQCLGGKGLVAAAAAHRLGCHVKLVSLIGLTESHRAELNALWPVGLAADHLLPFLSANNRVWISISRAHEVVSLVERPDAAKFDSHLAVETVKTAIAGCDVILLAAENSRLFKIATSLLEQEQLRPVLLNLSAAITTDDDLSNNDIVRAASVSEMILLNRHEQSVLFNKLGVRQWAELPLLNTQHIVVTDGAAGGAFASAPFTAWRNYDSAAVLHPICPVGAGDTFFAAYAKARYGDGLPPVDCCHFAAEVAARKVGQLSSHLTA